jgi:hypothetical protein
VARRTATARWSSTLAAPPCEGDSFHVALQRTFTVPDQPSVLSFRYDNLSFDTSNRFIPDAFEAALVGSDNQALTYTIGSGKDAFFNVNDGKEPVLGANAGGAGQDVSLNLDGLPAGSSATLVLRLVNNDADREATVRITDFQINPASQRGVSGVTPDAVPAHSTRAIDVAGLADVSASFAGEYRRTAFDEDTHTLHADLAVRNVGGYAVGGPLLVGVAHISDPTVGSSTPTAWRRTGPPTTTLPTCWSATPCGPATSRACGRWRSSTPAGCPSPSTWLCSPG